MLKLIGASDVAGDRDSARSDLGGNTIQRLLLPPADHDGGAFLDEGLRDGAADSAARAGYDCDLIFQCVHFQFASTMLESRSLSQTKTTTKPATGGRAASGPAEGGHSATVQAASRRRTGINAS